MSKKGIAVLLLLVVGASLFGIGYEVRREFHDGFCKKKTFNGSLAILVSVQAGERQCESLAELNQEYDNCWDALERSAKKRIDKLDAELKAEGCPVK